MTTSITRLVSSSLIACILMWGQTASAEESPHWKKTGCQSCHLESAPSDGVVNLVAADAEAVCDSCHGDRGDAIPCRHSSGLQAGAVDVPDTLSGSLKEGKIVCTTCHDVVYQCEHPTLQSSFYNRGFLRDRTSRISGDYCGKCHDRSVYAKLNPHAGVTGAPPRPTCTLCHTSVPAADKTGTLAVEFNMAHDLNDACRGCHNVRAHPKSMSFGSSQDADDWVHLVTPSQDVLDNMREARAASGIELPLDPQTGKVFCATCHNPHEFKVGGEHGSAERAIEHRLRIHDICQACHDK